MKSLRYGFVLALGAGAASCMFLACGGDDVSIAPPDGSTTDGAADGTMNNDGAPPDQNVGDTSKPPTCAAPTDPSKAAVCITMTPEAIDFIKSDIRFDGQGVIFVGMYSDAHPPNDGGADIAPPQILPAQDGGLAQLDLSSPIPVVRFDNLPTGAAYPRAFFFDDLAAIGKVAPGTWIGGYDLTNGLSDAGLNVVTLTAGVGVPVAMDLRALRGLVVQATLDNNLMPIGNGAGPGSVLVTDSPNFGTAKLWGFGQTPCANLEADGGATMGALFIGGGPRYAIPAVDDLGGGGSFPPGTITTVTFVDGGPQATPTDQFDAGNAYIVQKPITMDYVSPSMSKADKGMCP